MIPLFQKHQQEIAHFIKSAGVSYLAVFGSQARGDALPDSDVDLLVDYRIKNDLFDVANHQMLLEKMLQKKVDLVTVDGLNKKIAPYIKDDLRVIYEEKSSVLS